MNGAVTVEAQGTLLRSAELYACIHGRHDLCFGYEHKHGERISPSRFLVRICRCTCHYEEPASSDVPETSGSTDSSQAAG